MTRRISFSLALLLPVALHAQALPQLSVAAKPLTAIGSADAPENEQLTNVTGARRLSDGRVVVANGKPLELRIYSPLGKFLQRVGRKGQGPGEFRGKLDLLAAGGDSILVWDGDNLRLTLFSPSGKLVREWTSTDAVGSPRGQTILYHRALLQGLTVQLNACARQLLDAIPPVKPPAVREVHSDGTGRFWVHTDGETTWTVYSPDGRALGTVHLPKGVELYQAGAKFLVGKILLEDDIEQVRVFSLAGAAARPSPACMGRGAAGQVLSEANAESRAADFFPVPTVTPQLMQLKLAMRKGMTAAEMAFSDLARYPSTADSFPEFTKQLPPNVVARVLSGGRFGYLLATFDEKSTLTCAMRAGGVHSAVGWPDMKVVCSP